MRRFQNVPISKKLIITFGVIAIVALLISITFLSITSWLYERNRALIELHTTAELIGANSNAALVFNDVKAAKETLSTLQTLGDIVFAALYDSNGKEFARYLRDGHENIVTNLLSTVRVEDQIARCYSPFIAIDAGHIQTGHHAQQLRQRGVARAPNIFFRNNKNSRW